MVSPEVPENPYLARDSSHQIIANGEGVPLLSTYDSPNQQDMHMGSLTFHEIGNQNGAQATSDPLSCMDMHCCFGIKNAHIKMLLGNQLLIEKKDHTIFIR